MHHFRSTVQDNKMDRDNQQQQPEIIEGIEAFRPVPIWAEATPEEVPEPVMRRPHLMEVAQPGHHNDPDIKNIDLHQMD